MLEDKFKRGIAEGKQEFKGEKDGPKLQKQILLDSVEAKIMYRVFLFVCFFLLTFLQQNCSAANSVHKPTCLHENSISVLMRSR